MTDEREHIVLDINMSEKQILKLVLEQYEAAGTEELRERCLLEPSGARKFYMSIHRGPKVKISLDTMVLDDLDWELTRRQLRTATHLKERIEHARESQQAQSPS